jgi:hypothetical protein
MGVILVLIVLSGLSILGLVAIVNLYFNYFLTNRVKQVLQNTWWQKYPQKAQGHQH